MKYRRLGRSGLRISPLVLGTMNFGNPTDKGEAFRIIDAAIEVSLELAKRAAEKGCTVAQFAVVWVMSQPAITGAIIGPRDLEQFESLLPALDITLDQADLEFCDALVPPGTYVSNHFNTSNWMK